MMISLYSAALLAGWFECSLAGAGGSGGELKIEHVDPNEITFTGPPTPPGNVFGDRERQTVDIERNPQPLADTLPCGELKTAKANDLMILANHEFAGRVRRLPIHARGGML